MYRGESRIIDLDCYPPKPGEERRGSECHATMAVFGGNGSTRCGANMYRVAVLRRAFKPNGRHGRKNRAKVQDFKAKQNS
jgi:hypothetical protein